MTTQTIDPTQTPLEKWSELKFGMFIHFGVYSMLAGKWRGEKVSGLAEWMPCRKMIPLAEYVEVAKAFNPVDWDPEAVVKLAVDAGMKYLVITAKHHDGFALYDSKASGYNSIWAACGRDLLKPLVEACRRHGILPGFYYSQDLDWHDPDGGLNTWDFPEDQKNFAAYLDRKAKPQLIELLTNYGDIGVIWFDTPITITHEQSRELTDLVHRLQPDCILNSRIGHGFGDFESLGDNQVPGGSCQEYAETAGTLNDSWGFKEADHNWKTPREVILQLCELTSKKVNYLLNIGPDGQGRVPAETTDCLHAVGEWIRACGEAIYATRPNPFPLSFSWGGITLKDKRMFLLITSETARDVVLGGVLSEPQAARLLGEPGRDIAFDYADGILRFDLGGLADSVLAGVPVIEVVFSEEPRFDTRLAQQPDGSILLPAHLCRIHASNQKTDDPGELADLPADKQVEYAQKRKLWGDRRPAPWVMQIEPGGFIDKWTSTESFIEWEFELADPGSYEVWVQSVSSKYEPWVGGHRVRAEVAGDACTGTLVEEVAITSPRSRYYPENACRIGTLRMQPGRITLRLRALSIHPLCPEGLAVSEVRLTKVQQG
jgi:alpha-L-fucosidase